MKKLPGIIEVVSNWLLVIGFLLFAVASIGSIQAQEAVEIPGPELKDASFIPVKELKIGDWVFVKSEEGLIPEQIAKLDYHQEEVEVYNLSVDGEETFFANDFAVHNKAGTDTTKPQCRVIVNPTTSNVNSLVKNRSFSNPSGAGQCPNQWWNWGEECIDIYGLWTKSGTVPGCSACGNQYIEVGYTEYKAYQDISGLSTGSKVLYKVSAWGKGNRATIRFRNAGGIYGTFAYLNPGGGGWKQGSLLGWANYSNTERITLNCFKCDEDTGGASFDLVSLQKLKGADVVDSLDVDLYVAYYDNRNVAKLRHWNAGGGGGAPGWDSDDSRVIPFGPTTSTSPDPIPHTLDEYGSKTINVQVRDGSGNVSDTCQATITSEAPIGTIIGNVYQNEWGECDEDGRDNPPDGWRVTCKKGEPEGWNDEVDANMTGNQYQCVDSTGKTEIDQGDYIIKIYLEGDLVSEGWALIPPAEHATCSENSLVVSLDHNSGATPGPTFYLWQGFSEWYQTQEGDVHADGGTIDSPIPLTTGYFSIADVGDYPGLISYNDSEPEFGRGDVSEKGWLADDGFSVTHRYDYFYGKLGSPEADDIGGDLEDYVESHPDQDVFYVNGDVVIKNEWDFPDGDEAIILINGNLTIDKEINGLPVGSFLGFIVSGDINITGQIGDKVSDALTGTEAHLQGVYIADGVINTYYNKGVGDGSGFRLVAAGIFVASEFYLYRDVKDDCSEEICNETTPSEIFIARPDLFINIPDELKTSYFFEQEVAP